MLQKRHIQNVPLIIPLLKKEYRSETRKLSDINQELSSLESKLKEKGRTFQDLFLTKTVARLAADGRQIVARVESEATNYDSGISECIISIILLIFLFKELHSTKEVLAGERARAFQLQVEVFHLK